jgi:ferrous iron transport protein B
MDVGLHKFLIATIFIGGLVPAQLAGIVSAGAVVAIAVVGIFFSLAVSWGLSRICVERRSIIFQPGIASLSASP